MVPPRPRGDGPPLRIRVALGVGPEKADSRENGLAVSGGERSELADQFFDGRVALAVAEPFVTEAVEAVAVLDLGGDQHEVRDRAAEALPEIEAAVEHVGDGAPLLGSELALQLAARGLDDLGLATEEGGDLLR